MRPSAAAVVYLCVAAIDLRKQAASLALLVEQSLKRDVFAPALYVFSNAQARSDPDFVLGDATAWCSGRSVSSSSASSGRA